MRKIIKLEPAIPALPKRKKVAAYARVSMESEKLMHSLSAKSVISVNSFRKIRNGNMPECTLTNL